VDFYQLRKHKCEHLKSATYDVNLPLILSVADWSWLLPDAGAEAIPSRVVFHIAVEAVICDLTGFVLCFLIFVGGGSLSS